MHLLSSAAGEEMLSNRISESEGGVGLSRNFWTLFELETKSTLISKHETDSRIDEGNWHSSGMAEKSGVGLELESVRVEQLLLELQSGSESQTRRKTSTPQPW